jgi:AcrR family transcriptional regulator
MTGTEGSASVGRREWTPTEVAVLDAVKRCCERWGIDKVTVDDIARESGVSRATMYRMFPGGRDVIFEAHRVHELDKFFTRLLHQIEGAASLEDLLVRTVTSATRELRGDDHIALMLASEPGAVLGELTVEGLPRIIRVATAYLIPFADEFLPRPQSRLSSTSSPVSSSRTSSHRPAVVDFGDETSARRFLVPFLPVLPDLRSPTTQESHP